MNILTELKNGTVWNVDDGQQIHRPPTGKELAAARAIEQLIAQIQLLERTNNTLAKNLNEYQSLYENQRKTSAVEPGPIPSGRHSDVPERSTSSTTENAQSSDSSSSTANATNGAAT